MVVVKIELWPGGDETQARSLGVARIANDGTGTESHGNYDVELAHSGRYVGRPGVWRCGTVRGHYRMLSPYHLVLAAMRAALGIRG